MTLDLSFLAGPLPRLSARRRPVNVYDVLREGWRETRVDMTLQFFLDPSERHGLGSLVIDALLRALEGAASIGPEGRTDFLLHADDLSGSIDWEIRTQVDYIDLYAANPAFGIALVVENKIGHVLNNPLRKYAGYARTQGYDRVFVAVLAPEAREHLDDEQRRFTSASISYDDLSAEIRAAPELLNALLAPTDLDQRRSLDLLQQFIEARGGRMTMSDLEDEARLLGEWRHVADTHSAAIAAFESARNSVVRLIRDRGRRLEPLLRERLDAASLQTEWEAHGASRTEAWNAYYFPEADWTIELKFSVDPRTPAIFVYDRRGKTTKDQTIAPLDVPWAATDELIADRFIERARGIFDHAKAGLRGTPE